MEGVTLRGSLLPACIIQNNNQKNTLNYSHKFNCITLLLIKKLSLSVGDPGAQIQSICIIPEPCHSGGPIDTMLYQLEKIYCKLR